MSNSHLSTVLPTVALVLVSCAHAPPTVGTTTATAANLQRSAPPLTATKERAEVIPLPPGATLIDSARVSEIRAFPEEVLAGGAAAEGEAAIGVNTSDTSYATDMSYGDVVAFLDRALPTAGCMVSGRTALESGTFWTVRCKDGTLARIAARSTTPRTLEIVTTSKAEAQSPEVPVP